MVWLKIKVHIAIAFPLGIVVATAWIVMTSLWLLDVDNAIWITLTIIFDVILIIGLLGLGVQFFIWFKQFTYQRALRTEYSTFIKKKSVSERFALYDMNEDNFHDDILLENLLDEAERLLEEAEMNEESEGNVMAKKHKKWKLELSDEEVEIYNAVYDITIRTMKVQCEEAMIDFKERMIDFKKLIVEQMVHMNYVEKLLTENDQEVLDYFRIKSGTDLEKLEYLGDAVNESLANFKAEWLIAASVGGDPIPYPGVEKSPRRYFEYTFCIVYYFVKNYPVLYKRVGVGPRSEEEQQEFNDLIGKLLKLIWPYQSYLAGISMMDREIIELIRKSGVPKT